MPPFSSDVAPGTHERRARTTNLYYRVESRDSLIVGVRTDPPTNNWHCYSVRIVQCLPSSLRWKVNGTQFRLRG